MKAQLIHPVIKENIAINIIEGRYWKNPGMQCGYCDYYSLCYRQDHLAHLRRTDDKISVRDPSTGQLVLQAAGGFGIAEEPARHRSASGPQRFPAGG